MLQISDLVCSWLQLHRINSSIHFHFHNVPILTNVDFVVRLEVPLLVETAAADRAAVRFLPRVDQLMPLQFVSMREFFAAHCAVVVDLLLGRLQQLSRYFYWYLKLLSARMLFPYVGNKDGEISSHHKYKS